ncbi:hypothetical protein KP79_PYT23346 [Mizuhopecten yessoensis]|uniref:Uncharacterized protein n=1 Tax=Mizuhopecten yessoensis TaxID=6573 RepID=A0A210PQ04_MIZYE|nr:hypothetical protein KP79_PYT23346 [Mizuhopecten yessoensis]
MNNVLLFLVVPCLLGFLFVQSQNIGYGGGYGGGGGYGDAYNRALAGQYLQSQRTGFLGLTTGELIGAFLTLYALYYLTNGTAKMAGK